MKRGSNIFRLFSHIFVIVLVLIMSVAFTFSWYAPKITESTGNELDYKINGKTNKIEGCSIKTYGSTNDNGIIKYLDVELTDFKATIPSGGNSVYYRTVISNNNTGDALVSLYTNGVKGDAFIGVYSPEKTYEKPSGTPFCIADNIVIPNAGSVTVYWYISGAEGATVEFEDLFVAYN